MIELNGINFEYPTISKTINLGYEPQLLVKRAISGREHIETRGNRLVGSWSYIWLTNTQVEQLYNLLEVQKNEYVFARINTPTGLFEGNVFISVDDLQKRYVKNAQTSEYIWIGYSVSIRGVDLI